MNKSFLERQLQKLASDLPSEFEKGVQKADIVQGGGRKGAKKGASPVNKDYKPGAGVGYGYGQSVLDPRFKKAIKEQGVSLKETPAQFAGAYASRLVVDAANDGSRTYWWRYNHPFAIAQAFMQKFINQSVIKSPTLLGATSLAVAAPALSAAGNYDITNPQEQFRPKGYAQTYTPLGAKDRRISSQPVQETLERMFFQRPGRPLKYETAKQDIPDLTPRRYGNYMNYLYNDKGLLNLGIVKGTMENLEGVPEARIIGFPASLPMVGGFAGGTAAGYKAAKALPTTSPVRRALGVMGAGLAGSTAGVLSGKLVNSAVATANRPQLPTVQEYQG